MSPTCPPTRVLEWCGAGVPVPWLVVLKHRLRVSLQDHSIEAKLVVKWQFHLVFDVDLLVDTVAEYCSDDFDSILRLAKALDGMCRAWALFTEPLPHNCAVHYTHNGMVYHGVDVREGQTSMELQGFKGNYFYCRVAEWLNKDESLSRLWT